MAVAKALNPGRDSAWLQIYVNAGRGTWSGHFTPSTNPAQAWPIIDEYKIATIYWGDDGDDGNPWGAQVRVGGGHYIDTTPSDEFGGPTALIAAMRALVAHFAEVGAR